MDRKLAGIASRARIARIDSGFTLIESLTAATILLIVAGAVVTTLVATAGWYAKATIRTQAATIANQSMAVILSRNNVRDSYLDHGETTTAVWPVVIPLSRNETSPMGVFSVETSMADAVDPATGIPMTRIIVTAYPANNPLDPPVSVTRYASGWQTMPSVAQGLKVPVHVQCSIHAAGVRVQLLDPDTLAELRYAVTDSTGLAVFSDVQERPDGYFLTSDPRFGTDIRPQHFPTRVLPTHGGSIENPIMSVNNYSLAVVRSSVAAVLRIGVYRGAGWRFSDGVPVSTTLPYSTIEGLTVYAKPVLNSIAADTGMNGVGNQNRYPNDQTLVYSGTVNAYGVAVIQIPWTTEPDQNQHWTVWCTTQVPGQPAGPPHVLQCSPVVTGGWPADTLSATRPELPATGSYTDIPQWPFLGAAVAGTPDPTPPQ